MPFKTKIVKNVDDELWRKFSGKCKIDNTLTGHKLNEILKDYLKNQKVYK